MPIIRYKSESNSQRGGLGGLARARCLCQSLDTSLKAIHNTSRWTARNIRMFMPIIRYKSESNSQQPWCRPARSRWCLCQSLDTSLKAIHNTTTVAVAVRLMFMPIIRYKSESNSQWAGQDGQKPPRCLCQSLDTSLKAIPIPHHSVSEQVIINDFKERCIRFHGMLPQR